MKLKAVLLGVGFTVTASFSHAEVISLLGYTLDQESSIITAPDGRQWLQWDETIGWSAKSATHRFGGAGGDKGGNWEIATEDQIYDLYNDTGLDDARYDYLGDDRWTISTKLEPNSRASQFQQLFGITDTTSTDFSGGSHQSVMSGGTFLINDYRTAGQDGYFRTYISRGLTAEGSTITNYWEIADVGSHTGFKLYPWPGFEGHGIALTRPGSSTGGGGGSVVPLPAAGWLFVSAIAGLFARRRLS